MADYVEIGRPTPRVDGLAKVTGAARYVADQAIPGALSGRLVHSTRSHARIVSIDTSEARALPGVHAVITGEDVGHYLYGRMIKDIPVLARDVVRYSGERVAAVAAETEEIARHAADLIDVTYEELPAVLDLDAALDPGAPVLHPDLNAYPGMRPLDEPANAYRWTVSDRGDLDAGFADADVIVEGEYETQRHHQAYLEPHASIVSIEDGRAHVWTNTKVPQNIRDDLAATVGISRDAIVLHHSHIGGDFGGKGTPMDLPVCYFLARAAGRPVRMVADYIEEFMAGMPRHATRTRLRTGVRHDGTITAHHVQFFVNSGAYAGYKPAGVIGGAPRAAGPYRIPNTRIEAVHVYTNTVPGGHMRAPGSPQAVFALESHLDEVAGRLGLDPFEFRMRNLVEDGDETAWGQLFDDVRVKETLEAAVEAAGYTEPKRPFVGRGIAVGDHASGGGIGNAEVALEPGGGVVLGTAIFDQGSGTHTTLQQVVAEELGAPLHRIRLEVWDTDGTVDDSGIGGSRASRVNTKVAHEAAQDARRKLVELAAERLGEPEAAITIDGDELRVEGHGRPLRWPELLAEWEERAIGRAYIEDTEPMRVTGFVAQIAEVEVDPETGEIEVIELTTAHDVGRVLNPVGHQGQINGGVVQGLGYALMEELTLEDGRVATLSFGDYKIPTSLDIPPLRTVLIESDAGVGPYTIKGIGETPNVPVAAAIANAVADAVGVRIADLPLTSEKVYRALRDEAARSSRAGSAE